jgi:hypothetical protein
MTGGERDPNELTLVSRRVDATQPAPVVFRVAVVEGPDAAAQDDLLPDVVDYLEQVLAQRLPLVTARELVVAEFERRYVARTLADHGGHVPRAAAAAGIARRHFQRLKARSRR